MSRCDDNNRDDLMKFVLKAPFDEFIISMDCKDGCEQIAHLAELVAAGADIKDVLPELEEHMGYWKDCREEFEALVAIIKAERQGELPSVPASPKSDQSK
ncbi:MAG TPA: hypothetical protein VHL11_01195 [Phototrophicaceae bacterium]|jgi:hypothetical protein|nr:hypothetical protein [Phototrophicaceae bacterium]